MTYTEKILTEFDSKYIKGDFGITTCDPHVVPLKSLKAFISTSIHQALAEEREKVRKDYTKWVLSDNYKRKYTGETPFREWKEKAEVQDMSNWE